MKRPSPNRIEIDLAALYRPVAIRAVLAATLLVTPKRAFGKRV